MSVDSSLKAGLEAYRRGDFAAARLAWESLAEAADGESQELALALVRLAAALDEERNGRHASARTLYAALPGVLAELPDRLLRLDVARLRGALPADAAAALAQPPPLTAAPALPRRAVVRFLVLLLLVAAGFVLVRWSPLGAYLDRDVLRQALDGLRTRWWAPLLLIGLYLVACPIGLPATPLVFAGAVVFGTAWGGLYNFIGTFLGAVASFLLAHLLGRELLVHIAGPRRLARVERLLARHGFWALVQVRMIPIPFPIVNFGAAMAGVSLRHFAASSALGLAPATLAYSWCFAELANAATGSGGQAARNLVIALATALLVAILPSVWKGWQRKRRYRRLLAARREADLRAAGRREDLNPQAPRRPRADR